MTTSTIRVADSLHRAIKELATKEGYSMNEFLITAATEELMALETVSITFDLEPSEATSRILTAFWPGF